MGSASPQIFDGHPFIYAGLWRRLQASILDFLVLWPLTMALDTLLRLSTGLPFGADVIFEFTSQWVQMKYEVMEEVWIGTSLLYFAAFESSSWQATPGEYWIGLAVFDQNGHRLSFLHALGRTLCKCFSFAPPGLGFLMIPWTARKQALHDMMTGCLVMEWLETPEQVDVISKGTGGEERLAPNPPPQGA
jgi:uncharacterized RDD family membrane protein YckC